MMRATIAKRPVRRGHSGPAPDLREAAQLDQEKSGNERSEDDLMNTGQHIRSYIEMKNRQERIEEVG